MNELDYSFTSGTSTGMELFWNTEDAMAATITATTIEFPNPLIDWLPYKIERYIPTWHLMRSYRK